MQGMLSLLLFAGALHVDLSELKAYRWQVGTLAVLGTLPSPVATLWQASCTCRARWPWWSRD